MLHRTQSKTQLDETIAAVHESMKTLTPDDPAYAAHVDQLQKLYEIKDPKAKTRTHLKDWIPVIGSVGTALVIVVFEARGHAVTSKALSFVPKLKA